MLKLVALSCVLLAQSCAMTDANRRASGEATSFPNSEPAFLRPIALLPAVTGEYSWPISTDNTVAQEYFDQGIQLRYSFATDAAARSFRASWRADANCAICYWGEAYALGGYLNVPQTSRRAPYALKAIRKAAELAPNHASPIEQALINATLARYVENFEPKQRRKQDEAFARAMSVVQKKYPEHMDVATITASAWFLLEDRRGWRELDDPNVARIHRLLEGVLANDLRHPGACHLYVHATESSDKPELSLPCAEMLGELVPGASHMNHMPSHVWNEVGRWGDSVRANLRAVQSDVKAAQNKGVAIYPPHNLHMLAFAASYDGQGAIAMRAGKKYTEITDDPMHELLTLIRFGEFNEIRGIARPDGEISRTIWEFAQGYTDLRQGNISSAKQRATAVFAAAESTEAIYRFHPAEKIFHTLGFILQGEIHRERDDLAAAISSFNAAVAAQDSMQWDEPEAMPFAARHWLGAALLETGRAAEAEQAYRAELIRHPMDGWSLHGLELALNAQKKIDADANRALAESWARADTWLPASRF